MAMDKFSLNEDSFVNVKTEDLDESALDLFLNDEVQPIKKGATEDEEDEQPKLNNKKKEQQKEEEEEDEDFELNIDEIVDEDEENEKPNLKNKKKEEPKEDEQEERQKEEDNEGSVFSTLSRELLDLGIFTLNEDEQVLSIQSAEEFKERFEIEQKKKAANTIDQFLSKFGDDYADAFQAIFVNGVAPREYLSQVVEIENVSNLDLSDEEAQRFVLKKHYKTLGWDDNKIESRIQRFSDYGDLETEARDVHEVLIKQEEKKLETIERDKIKQDQEKQARKEQHDTSVLNIIKSKLDAKEFDSIPVDKNFAQSTLNFLTQDKYKTNDGQLLTEFDNFFLSLKKPENWEKKVKLAMLINWMEKDPTFSKLQRTLVSNESNALFKGLAKHAKKTTSNLGKSQMKSFI